MLCPDGPDADVLQAAFSAVLTSSAENSSNSSFCCITSKVLLHYDLEINNISCPLVPVMHDNSYLLSVCVLSTLMF